MKLTKIQWGIEVKDGVSRLTSIVATTRFNQVSPHVILQAATANQYRTLNVPMGLKSLLNDLPPELSQKSIYLPLIRR